MTITQVRQKGALPVDQFLTSVSLHFQGLTPTNPQPIKHRTDR